MRPLLHTAYTVCSDVATCSTERYEHVKPVHGHCPGVTAEPCMAGISENLQRFHIRRKSIPLPGSICIRIFFEYDALKKERARQQITFFAV